VAAALSATLPPLASQMLAVGEESGQLDALCLRVADAYDGDVRRSLRTMVALVEPAMILVFGTLVGFVALAMLQAIYGINFNAF
jgi:type II secretory pathway component PulF